MKRLIAVSLIMAAMVLAGGVLAPAQAQTPANDLKPTFISPTPGLYVNGWPAFTVSYPKEWEEMPPTPGAALWVGAPRPGLPPSDPSLGIVSWPSPRPLEDWAEELMPYFVEYYTGFKVLSDKPSQLKDGTPAREVEYEFVLKHDPTGGSVENGPKKNGLLLATKEDLMWVAAMLIDDKGKIGEDLRRVAYSLTLLQGRDEPVQVPPDVRAFFDMWCADAVSHDVKALMVHFSDRFRHSGMNKAFTEQMWRNSPMSPIRRGIISCEVTVTVFERRGDKAYVDGFILDKAKGDATALKMPMMFQQIINEHGQWKWFGNQK
jgi:hypothetical protein